MTRYPTTRRQRFGLVPILFAVTFVAYTAPARAADPDFKALMRNVLDSWQTMDPAKAGVHYSKESDAVYFDIAPLKYAGWGAYEAGTKELFKDWTSLTLVMNDDIWIEKHGDVAVTAVTGRADVVEKSGTKNSLEWRWTGVWEKEGKDWLIAHDHLSVPLPMPPTAEAK
jgi:ketosteroid isomerase-like protein